MLVCSVRGCGLPLERHQRRLVCAQGHSFDLARSGYVNLLQPQERRSKRPGDTPEAVAARRRLHDSGATAPLLEAIRATAVPVPEDVILDAGCGEGFFLGNLTRAAGPHGCGVDISTHAIDAAARRYPDCTWVVANADRFLPFADRSYSLILSITARMNAPEFRRVIRDDGRLLVAVPAPADLIELRGAGRDRVERTVECFSDQFRLVGQHRVSTSAALDSEAVTDLLHLIYRPIQPSAPAATQVTLALDLLLFHPYR